MRDAEGLLEHVVNVLIDDCGVGDACDDGEIGVPLMQRSRAKSLRAVMVRCCSLQSVPMVGHMQSIVDETFDMPQFGRVWCLDYNSERCIWSTLVV